MQSTGCRLPKSKLWRYNLHYFDYLHWPVYPAAMKAQLIDSWIAANPATAGDGWEPYPVSLRVVNWIKAWLSVSWAQALPQHWLDSLATQLAWLEQRLEYHLLANHLLKNGKALFFGGVFFTGPEADRWRGCGLQILLREADEQILPDGGHIRAQPDVSLHRAGRLARCAEPAASRVGTGACGG